MITKIVENYVFAGGWAITAVMALGDPKLGEIAGIVTAEDVVEAVVLPEVGVGVGPAVQVCGRIFACGIFDADGGAEVGGKIVSADIIDAVDGGVQFAGKVDRVFGDGVINPLVNLQV